MEETEQLKQRLAELEARLDEEKKKTADAKEENDEVRAELKKATESSKQSPKPVYIAPGRRLEIFKDRPTKPGDVTVHDWIVDVRGQLELRGMTTKEAAAYIKDHLAGNARKEILGRGEEVGSNPDKIISILERVFGDGDSLPQLQQRFFSYKQAHNEDLLDCSLMLVTLYDRIGALDPTYLACRESSLKGRLAEAVTDEGLRRELRRLNVESPSLSYFQLRDRAIEWLGTLKRPNSSRRETTVNEVSFESNVLDLLRQQGEQIAAQQKQLDSLLATHKTAPRLCFTCNKPGHISRNCDQRKSAQSHKVNHPRQQKPALN